MYLKKIAKFKESLLFRLTVLYAGAFTVLAALGFGFIYYRLYSEAIARMDWELVAEVSDYAELMADKGFEGVRTKILEDGESEDPEEEFYRLMSDRGEVFVSTDMSAWGDAARLQVLAGAKNNPSGHFLKTMSIVEGDNRARTITAIIGPSLFIQIGESLEETDEYLAIFRNLFILLIVTLIIISTAIGWALAKRALGDMEAISKTAEEITSGAYERRVPTDGSLSETRRLAVTINVMLDRIQNLLHTMQQINDNIAHDLRSPLARIRGIAEMSLVKEKPIEEYREMAVSTIEECDALIEMINTMLDITEIEAGVNTAHIEEFDLSILVAGACELFDPIADEKNIILESQLPEQLLFHGDQKRMQRIITNLIENAIKYTPAYGTVVVSAKRDNGTIAIAVEDNGTGISDTDLPYIFKRFYRCDHSRTQGGVGLGLSLVKAYAESMKGIIAVKSYPSRGSVFTICFTT